MAYQAKTKPNSISVSEFLSNLEDSKQKQQSLELITLFEAASSQKAEMWGDSIIGFGRYHYRYASGHEGEWMRGGFSPRKGKFSLYLMDGANSHPELLEKLGKFKTGKACLYIKSLDDIDRSVLESLIMKSFEAMAVRYPEE